MTTFFALLALAFAQDPTYDGAAAPAEATDKPETHLTAELGGSFTFGNTWVFNATGSLKLDHKWGQNLFHADFGVLLNMAKTDLNGNGTLDAYDVEGEDGTITSFDEMKQKPVFTSQRINSNLRYDRFFGTSDSLFVSVGEQRDQFAGLLWRFNEQVGYARQVVDLEATKFRIEVGLAYNQENFTAGVADDGTATNTAILDAHYMAVQVAASLTHAFNDKVSIGDDLQLIEPVVGSFAFPNCTHDAAGTGCTSTLTNPTDFRLYNTFYLQAQIAERFSLKLSNYVQFDNQPVPGFRKVDTTTALTLVAAIL